MGFYTNYDAVFDAVETKLNTVSSIKQVNRGEQLRVSQLPLAIINPEETEIAQANIGDMLECYVGFSVIVVVRETEPENWFSEVVSVMGDVVDAVLSDRTLNSTVKDVIPTFFAPGEITFRSRLYYGGVVRFTALMYYLPS